ncbi:hypothetical protein VNO78_19807 [Psophocarpus tetragonolobus]|uniref:Uncharacterized protein n=1 Tax=Psophocarpus tetragonolobus TaxID=3891 RepID=A0AAN9S8R3_PSOTE
MFWLSFVCKGNAVNCLSNKLSEDYEWNKFLLMSHTAKLVIFGTYYCSKNQTFKAVKYQGGSIFYSILKLVRLIYTKPGIVSKL